ncbi:hypothetical protein GF327_09020 [Candidatus Woesearchaeota archaeon]|nr:hypothetical protein [Candidatus Woesearchaeota archaeon]
MIEKLKGAKKKDIHQSILRKTLRLFAEPLSLALSKTPVTPNQVSFVYLIFSVLVSYLYSKGQYGSNITGGILLFFLLILDKVDGSLSRIKGTDSDYGFWLDRTFNDFSRIILFFGLAIGLYRQTQNVIYIFITFFLMSTYLLVGITHEVFRLIMPDSNKILGSIKSHYHFLINFVYGEPLVPFIIFVFSFTPLLHIGVILLSLYGVLFLIAQYCVMTLKVKKQLSHVSRMDSKIK